jgi:Kef-type K+ transport system membrane component KefB
MQSGPMPLPVMMLIVYGAAKLMAEVFERFRQPGIVGEILAGVIVGPAILGWVQTTESLQALADLGVMFLLFRVGLETKASELLKVGGVATLVAICGVLLPLVVGWAIARAWGSAQVEAMFVGAAFVATSVGITAQVLARKGVLQARSAQIILAAAVIDDVLGLIVLAIVSGTAKGRLHLMDVVLTALLPVVFTVVIAKWGTHGVRTVVPRMEAQLSSSEAQFHLAVVVLFALACMALYVGIAAIVGAFLAGMSLSEHSGERVHTLVHGTSELLVPFFLAGIGLHISLSGLKNGSLILLACILLVSAVLTKLIGCGAAALSLGVRDAARIGIGMIPRGEVGMVVAQLGLAMAAISTDIYTVVVFVALATTIVAPPLLNSVYPTSSVEAKGEMLQAC